MKKILLLIILLFIILTGVFLLLKNSNKLTQKKPDKILPVPTGHYKLGDSPMTHENNPIEIIVSKNGFEPNDLSIKVGDVVIFKVNDLNKHDIESNPHPSHTLHKELNLGVIEGVDTKSLLLSKPGVYEYHDHLNPQNTGRITVE